MNYLYHFNKLAEKYLPILTPIAMLIGILFSDRLSPYLYLSTWIFAFLTFQGSLGSGVRDIKNVLQNPKGLLTTLFLLHVFMPLLAFCIGHLFFTGNFNLITGIIMEFIVPTGVMSMVWVTIYRGNIPLTLSIILVDTFLAPFLMPLTLKILVGTSIHMDPILMMKDLFFMIAIPAFIAMLCNEATHGKVKETVQPVLAPFGKVAIVCVIALNATKVAPYFKEFKTVYLGVMLAIFLLAASGYLWAFLAAKFLKSNRADTVSITFNGSMRNISAGAVIAAQYFPGEVVFPIMVGTLFQQILAATMGSIFSRMDEKKELLSKQEEVALTDCEK